MILPKGAVVYHGAKVYREGDDCPDKLIPKSIKNKAKADSATSTKDSKPNSDKK